MAPSSEMAASTSSCCSGLEAAGRMSSMEWEPKTLTLDQIKFAREAAMYVVSTKTEEEAVRIFTEGLKPVRITKSAASSSFDSSSDDDVDLGGGSSTKRCCCGGSKGGRRGGRRRSVVAERDVATAPF